MSHECRACYEQFSTRNGLFNHLQWYRSHRSAPAPKGFRNGGSIHHRVTGSYANNTDLSQQHVACTAAETTRETKQSPPTYGTNHYSDNNNETVGEEAVVNRSGRENNVHDSPRNGHDKFELARSSIVHNEEDFMHKDNESQNERQQNDTHELVNITPFSMIIN